MRGPVGMMSRSDASLTARNYRPNIQTVTQSFAQLVVGAPASGKSQMMNSFPITDPDAPNTTEGN
ncbi:hypothetical protein [Burkholderia sp. CCA53]|uniref:hypothetical protein n=1 Tax=Burkholderia sp. CCA53 TaxID=1776288 RepID=UPI0020C80B79|nr:hypothetical protein [Burkholderia sp. CCA53]